MTVLSISLILLVLVVLLLNLGLASRWHWGIKLLAIIIALLAVVFSYTGFQGLLGYPTSETLPEQAQLLAIDVQEPDKRTQSKGSVYIWLKPINERLVAPRAYQLPYSDELKDRATTAGRRLKQGGRTGVRRIKTSPSKESGADSSGSVEVEFYKFSSAKLPPKK